MKDINWNHMPEWADVYVEYLGDRGDASEGWAVLYDNRAQFNDGTYWRIEEGVRDGFIAVYYPPKQSEETVDETTSIRAILEEAFNKVYEQHGVRLHRVGFEYSRNLVGSVELLDVDVEGRL